MSAHLTWQTGTDVIGVTDHVLSFDVVKTESHDHTNTVTEHPVEQGANIIDHIRPNLNRVTIEGYISNAPVYSDDARQDVVTLSLPIQPPQLSPFAVTSIPQPPYVTAQVWDFPNVTDYVAQVYTTLDDLRSQGTLVSVVCPQATYDSMVVSSFKMDRDDSTGTGANFEIELTEVRVVSSSITEAPAPSLPQANTTKNTGNQAAKEPGTKQDALGKLLNHFRLGFT